MTQNNNLNDKEIISKLLSGGKDFEDASMYLFNAFRGFIPQVKEKTFLPLSQVQDAYADALVKMIRHLKDGRFRGESKLSSYFYTIFYNTAVDVSRKNSSNKNIPTLELFDYDARERDLLTFIENRDEANQVVKVINEMGDTCRKILTDWAYFGYSMEEIAKRADLLNAESARSMKYKCLKKLRNMLADKI